MMSRILFSTVAAAIVAAAAPAVAAEPTTDAGKPGCGACCERRETPVREDARAGQVSSQAQEEDPSVRNQSFGG